MLKLQRGSWCVENQYIRCWTPSSRKTTGASGTGKSSGEWRRSGGARSIACARWKAFGTGSSGPGQSRSRAPTPVDWRPAETLNHPGFTPTCVGTTANVHRRRASYGSPPRAWGQHCIATAAAVAVTVHPHVRGDRRVVPSIAHGAWPVHPHVRGDRRRWSRARQRPCRFTPTCVGTTQCRGAPLGASSGSPPRAWGQTIRPSATHRCRGSPPRAWGQTVQARTDRLQTSVHPHVRGDRPRAGPATTRQRTVHPHVRGDRLALAAHHHRRSAVHPHVRGDDAVVGHVRSPAVRFTPTCVGTTQRRVAGVIRLGSPPRAWGQTHSAHVRCAVSDGSPPRAWGRPCARRPSVCSRHRFTPTCVGTTVRVAWHLAVDPVHPHVRGDDYGERYGTDAVTRFTPTCVGTTDRRSRAATSPCRFTPTCVGTTTSPERLARAPTGSPPRAWGRRGRMQRCLRVAVGSPPRAWGRLTSGDAAAIAAAVHPHVRGEDCVADYSKHRPSGSPPRAWGHCLAGGSSRSAASHSASSLGTAPRTQSVRPAATHPSPEP